MSLIDEFRTPEEQWQTTENLKLARQFFRKYLENPLAFAELSNYDAIVLLPGDEVPNPELSWANMAMADQLSRQGQRIVTWPIDHVALSGPNIQPRWPSVLGEGAVMTYDGRRDVMTIVFSQPNRPSIPVRMNPSTTILIDSETHFVTSMTITKFLEMAVQKAPALGLFLFMPATTVVGMTANERGDAIMRVFEAVMTSTGATIEWQQIVEALSA